MGKGKRRLEQEELKRARTGKDLEAHKGFSKYQRKKMLDQGVDPKMFGDSL